MLKVRLAGLGNSKPGLEWADSGRMHPQRGPRATLVTLGSKPEFAAFGSNGCCLPPKCYADLPRRSNYNTTGAAYRRGIIQTSALCVLCRPRHNTHWTGSEKRLERIKKFANREAYAFEELVAEIGACFLGAQIGGAPEFGQSAAYVEGWSKALKEDKRAIFRAASEAQKAADFVLAAAGQSKAAAA